MSAGGITYGSAKSILATVAENGLSPNDPRVLIRVNEAIASILNECIPVNSMLTADVQADGTELFLPKEFEAAYEVKVLGDATEVYGDNDIQRGWFNIVNNFAYVSPDMVMDLELVDLFLQPDPNDASILRRKYDFPGLTPNAIVRVTGPKRYLPITQDNDYLIVQNLLAIKDMMQAIWKRENNDPQGAEIMHKACIDRLHAEIKKHLLDPTNNVRRVAEYDADLANYSTGTFGYTRARLAFELQGGLTMGKTDLTRLLEQAEMTLMNAGQWVGMLQEFTATVDGPTLLAPKEVEAIVAIEDSRTCSHPMLIKNLYARYQNHGHGWWVGCVPELLDEGEVFYPATGDRRRQYRLSGAVRDELTSDIRFIGLLRWVKKVPTDPMVIKNFEALRLACMSIMESKQGQIDESVKSKQLAIAELDRELNQYLSGQLILAATNFGVNFGRRCRGGVF